MPVILYPYIPETITVHLGAPDEEAENVTLPFSDYIKNVASSEIYPTWPESALRANIYAIVTFALNRIYTEWYRAQGYPFDVTSLTQYDQAFVKDRDIFENISLLVDELYNSYVVRQGSVAPLFTQFCNGTTSLCDGLSQWGTVSLAEQGYGPYEILQYYYGDDINIITGVPEQPFTQSYPGTPLKLGDAGNDVKLIQNWLNRISRNFPALPVAVPADGIFRPSTEEAVRAFQELFYLPVTGQVDQATWYRLKRYYTAVKELGELTSEGVSLAEATLLFPGDLALGQQGDIVRVAQYYLNVLATFNPQLQLPPLDGQFGEETQAAVESFQSFYGLPVTGVIDRQTWENMVRIYGNILEGLPPNFYGVKSKLYPGYFLSEGMANQDVADLQTYLSVIGDRMPQFPSLAVDGYFGPDTRDAVYTFQDAYGLPVNGAVGPVTWNEIAMLYDSLVAP